jgi:hypothetical protein
MAYKGSGLESLGTRLGTGLGIGFTMELLGEEGIGVDLACSYYY